MRAGAGKTPCSRFLFVPVPLRSLARTIAFVEAPGPFDSEGDRSRAQDLSPLQKTSFLPRPVLPSGDRGLRAGPAQKMLDVHNCLNVLSGYWIRRVLDPYFSPPLPFPTSHNPMPLRLVDIYRPDDETALALPDDTYDVLGHWSYALDDDQRVDRILVDVDETEALIDWADRAVHTEYRLTLQAVEATLPRPDEPDGEDEAPSSEEAEDDASIGRVGRAELYEYGRTASDVSNTYYALVLLSTIVAAGGMLRDQTAVVIGAMMIAPLIGPNISLALGTTLGDTSLLRRSIQANVGGVALAFGAALGMGVIFPVDPTTGEVALRTVIGLADVALAGAAGAAGALSVTRDGSTSLVGVMVAVALLPPIVAVGLLLGTGAFAAATQAGLLTVTNVVALNLAAVCTFLIQGVRPRDWRDVEQARTSTRIALTLWGAALVLLITVLWLSG